MCSSDLDGKTAAERRRQHCRNICRKEDKTVSTDEALEIMHFQQLYPLSDDGNIAAVVIDGGDIIGFGVIPGHRVDISRNWMSIVPGSEILSEV